MPSVRDLIANSNRDARRLAGFEDDDDCIWLGSFDGNDDLAVIRPRREVIRVGRCELRTASGQTGLGLGHVPGVVPSLEYIIERLRRRYAEIGHGGSSCSED